MPLFEVLSLLVLAGLAWFWFDSARAREIAVAAARDVCAADGLQFLDDTVAVAAMGAARDADGRLVLRRAYVFEYSGTGFDRRPGSVVLLGNAVASVYAGPRLAADE